MALNRSIHAVIRLDHHHSPKSYRFACLMEFFSIYLDCWWKIERENDKERTRCQFYCFNCIKQEGAFLIWATTICQDKNREIFFCGLEDYGIINDLIAEHRDEIISNVIEWWMSRESARSHSNNVNDSKDRLSYLIVAQILEAILSPQIMCVDMEEP